MTHADIIKRLEAATGLDREIDWRIAQAIGHENMTNAREDFFPPFMVGSRADKEIPKWSASLDATVALIERVLPGWELVSWSRCARLIHPNNRKRDIRASGYSRALAALLALFRALEAQEPHHG